MHVRQTSPRREVFTSGKTQLHRRAHDERWLMVNNLVAPEGIPSNGACISLDFVSIQFHLMTSEPYPNRATRLSAERWL